MSWVSAAPGPLGRLWKACCSTNLLTLDLSCCHGNAGPGRCVCVLIRLKKNDFRDLVSGAAPFCVLCCPLPFDSPGKELCAVTSSWGKQTLARCSFIVWGCKALYSSWSFLCSPWYTKICWFWTGLEDGGTGRRISPGEARRFKSLLLLSMRPFFIFCLEVHSAHSIFIDYVS